MCSGDLPQKRPQLEHHLCSFNRGNGLSSDAYQASRQIYNYWAIAHPIQANLFDFFFFSIHTFNLHTRLLFPLDSSSIPVHNQKTLPIPLGVYQYQPAITSTSKPIRPRHLLLLPLSPTSNIKNKNRLRRKSAETDIMRRTNSMADIPLPITYTPTTHRISKAKKGKRVHACEFPGCNKVSLPQGNSNNTKIGQYF